jgi:hypothetical protein
MKYTKTINVKSLQAIPEGSKIGQWFTDGATRGQYLGTSAGGYKVVRFAVKKFGTGCCYDNRDIRAYARINQG